MSKHYDYIVAGGGAAGRSLVYRLLQDPVLQQRSVLILEASTKDQNDRTWSFWENTNGPFEEIVYHRWTELSVFQGADFQKSLPIQEGGFQYKMIRGIDFYEYTDRIFATAPNVDYQRAWMKQITDTEQGVAVQTDQGTFTATYCFSSILEGGIQKANINYLDQHFRGWFIRTEQEVFEPSKATFMDFRTPQHGETRFFYVLPTSTREALVEIAIFSNNHLKPADYDLLISQYLQDYWPQIGPFQLQETEMGNIPMTDFSFRRRRGNTIFIGTAGGDTRASSGYTFYNIQRTVGNILALLAADRFPEPKPTFDQRRHQLYDSILLKVLADGYYPGDRIFRGLFAGNPPKRLLPFLNAETSVWQELQLMHTVPVFTFLKALADQFILPSSPTKTTNGSPRTADYHL